MTTHTITVTRVQFTWAARCTCGWRETMLKKKVEAQSAARKHRARYPR